MNFQGLKNVEDVDWLLDLAFSSAKKESDNLRSALKGNKSDRMEKSKKIEIVKLKTIKNAIIKQLMLVLKSFPSIDTLPEFYNELIKLTLEYDQLKKSLGALNWAVDKTAGFTEEYIKKIKRTHDPQKVNEYRRQYYGRVSSVLRQIKKNLLYLEESRKTMKDYPAIKSNIFTACIAGFPNVGKSTLLNKLTGAKAEIKAYAFTTKQLNTGYMKTDYSKVQFIDTPGTLNRFNKMNPVEQQAYLALKFVADIFVYVFDLTETYALADQKKLLLNLQKFDKDILIYISKTDILEKEKVDSFLKKSKLKKVYTDAELLADEIEKREKFWTKEMGEF